MPVHTVHVSPSPYHPARKVGIPHSPLFPGVIYWEADYFVGECVSKRLNPCTLSKNYIGKTFLEIKQKKAIAHTFLKQDFCLKELKIVLFTFNSGYF